MPGTLLDIAKMAQTAEIAVLLRARELTKFVALKILTYLVENTPVDTSQALSNWRIAVGGSSYGAQAIGAYFPGLAGSTQGASAAAAIAAAREALKKAQPKKAIAIINQVPYIQRLNEGWSAQSPGGFVEASLLVGKAAVREYNFNQKLALDIRRGRVTPDG